MEEGSSQVILVCLKVLAQRAFYPGFKRSAKLRLQTSFSRGDKLLLSSDQVCCSVFGSRFQ